LNERPNSRDQNARNAEAQISELSRQIEQRGRSAVRSALWSGMGTLVAAIAGVVASSVQLTTFVFDISVDGQYVTVGSAILGGLILVSLTIYIVRKRVQSRRRAIAAFSLTDIQEPNLREMFAGLIIGQREFEQLHLARDNGRQP